jgi:uncharacterized protein (TIGR02453 family)
MAPFTAFSDGTLRFFRQLKKNNNREWFEAHRGEYEQFVKAPAEAFADAINGRLARFAPDYITEPKKAIFRIYRDTRFSADKTPYKTHTGVLFRRQNLPKLEAGAFYVGISDDELGIAGGVYGPGPEQLLRLRQHLTQNHDELRRLLRSSKLKKVAGELQGEALKRPPKGFSADDPAIDFILRKQWYFFQKMEPAVAVAPGLVKMVAQSFEAMLPVMEFFNAAFAKKNGPGVRI